MRKISQDNAQDNAQDNDELDLDSSSLSNSSEEEVSQHRGINNLGSEPQHKKHHYGPASKPRYHRRYYYRGARNRVVICSNCSGKGHLFKDCKKPIQSYGVLGWSLRSKNGLSLYQDDYPIPSDRFAFMRGLYQTNNYDLCVCLIQRRHTISYEAFIRGKYDLDELPTHVERMTVYERAEILEKPWDVLYDNIMNDKGVDSKSNNYMIRERQRAKQLYDSVIADFPQVVEKAELIYEPTWEFPKGRKFVQETEEMCAYREFEEETSVPLQDVSPLNPVIWLEEQFCGLNKRMYYNRYMIALIDPRGKGPFLDETNLGQCAEVQNAKWFSYEEAMGTLHSFHPEKLECLRQSHTMVTRLFESESES